MVINTLQIQRNSFNKLLNEVQQELIAEEQEELETLDNILSPLESTKEDLEAEANRILDKVRKQGVDSLTDEEKDILTKYGK
jgi:predicted transcriptional regulator